METRRAGYAQRPVHDAIGVDRFTVAARKEGANVSRPSDPGIRRSFAAGHNTSARRGVHAFDARPDKSDWRPDVTARLRAGDGTAGLIAPLRLQAPTSTGRRCAPRGIRAKRTLDLLGATLAIILIAPLLLVVAALVKLTSQGPVFFRQTRIGRDGKEFHILKFRTMVVHAEERLQTDERLWALYQSEGYKIPAGEDPRLTRVGPFLRRSSLDELPQLLNVMRGHMSLVGPRPIQAFELGEYGEVADTYLSVRPGMSGLWQVSGRSNLDFKRRVALDFQYVETWSVTKDVLILARTVPAVVRRRGAT